MTILRLATRQSPLALAQSRWVADRLEATQDGLKVELVGMTTTGDVTVGPLADAGGKGLFTKEVEQALLRGEADLAVHSFKDVPVTMPLVDEAELVIEAVPERADPRDAIVTTTSDFNGPRAGFRFGTGSPRRRFLLANLWPTCVAVPIRGNVDTRIGRVDAGYIDAAILAAAGLQRLGRLDRLRVHHLDPEVFVPAAGQGALAIQCRRDAPATRQVLRAINHPPTSRAVAAERHVVALLDGDCHSAIGAFATSRGADIRLRVAFERDDQLWMGEATGDDGEEVARRAVDTARPDAGGSS